MARKASHAGSWYTENARELGNELDSYLQAAGLSKQSNARAVIAPHAGYRYSGRCAAFAFANIDPGTVSRVFILGPSHHHFTRKCALSRASIYKTPLGDLPVDLESEHRGSSGAQHLHGDLISSFYRLSIVVSSLPSAQAWCQSSIRVCVEQLSCYVESQGMIMNPGKRKRLQLTSKIRLSTLSRFPLVLRACIDVAVYEELKATGKFEDMDMNVDEAEHSMEMHLPYIAKVFQGSAVKVIPILVGALTYESEVAYGKILAKYIDSPSNFFSVSSDFCHWGSRFNYTYYEKRHGPIYKSIEALDQNGMNIIESGDPGAFRDYLQEYDNTICGQHPIAVFLNMLKHCATKLQIKFLQYEQSSRCKHMRDSSVSYASAVATVASA